MFRIMLKENNLLHSPVRGCRHICHLLTRDILWYEPWDRVADEHIRLTYVLPEELPYIFLWRSTLSHKVAAYLDVRSIEHWSIRCNIFDEWNQSRHLGIVDL
jgi:hypothetical protein